MGTVYRKSFTKPLPAGAEIIVRKGQRLARWKDAKGKTRMEPLAGDQQAEPSRIIVTAGTYTAKYRDGNGIVVEVATGCRDQDAARRVLAELERRAELVKAGVVTAAENAVADHQGTPLADHFAAYIDYLLTQAASKAHRDNVRRQLQRLAAECSFAKLADLGRDALERWLAAQAKAGMGARTRNTYLAAVVAFANWCIETNRLVANPFAKASRADERTDCRRKRRALTEAELVRLLDVARRRPLAVFGRLTVRKDAGDVKRKRDTWKAAPLTYADLDAATDRARERLTKTPAKIALLERLGRERALIYKTLVLTGLRRGELASLTVGQLDLTGSTPCIVLDSADEKNRAGSTLPIRSDLAADFALWLKERDERGYGDSGAFEGGLCLPMTGLPQAGLPADAPLFDVPEKLVKVLDRDLKLAGIAKRDERGRTFDVHAMRHTFGSLLSKGGVAPRTAQAAMRHAKIDLTMNVYTDPKVLDVAGALDALPTLPLDGAGDERQEQRATGTDDRYAIGLHQLAPLLAPNSGQAGTSESFPDKMAGEPGAMGERATMAENPCFVGKKTPLSLADNGVHQMGDTGLEPVTPSLSSKRHRVLSSGTKELTATASHACTAACTRNPENDNATAANQAGDHAANDAEPVADQGADSLAALAAALKGLSTAERAKLAAMLADGDDDDNAAGKPKAASEAKGTTKRPARKGDV